MKKIYIWDPVVRLFHWGTVAIVILNLTLFEEGKIHNNLGYVLAGLIAVRLIWGVIGSRHARFSNFIPSYQALQAYLNIGPQVDRAKKE